MPILTGWATNIGVTRKENQDSCYVCTSEYAMNVSAVAAMCDGMGGLSDGALASRTVCAAVEEWYSASFLPPSKVMSLSDEDITRQLTEIITDANRRLARYGSEKNIRVGTTASVLFMLNGKYFIFHVGDSRVYHYSSTLKQLTDDDCVAAEKLRRGEISRFDYEKSNQKHLLTQCVGVNDKLNIHIYTGEYSVGDVFFLCSDGMYHYLPYSELVSILIAQQIEKGSRITSAIERIIDRMISRGEKDNLSGIILCAV